MDIAGILLILAIALLLVTIATRTYALLFFVAGALAVAALMLLHGN